jgi:hypothetical protein
LGSLVILLIGAPVWALRPVFVHRSSILALLPPKSLRISLHHGHQPIHAHRASSMESEQTFLGRRGPPRASAGHAACNSRPPRPCPSAAVGRGGQQSKLQSCHPRCHIEASRDNIPQVHARQGHTAPPLSDPRDSAYTATTTDSAGNMCWAFTTTGVVTPTNDSHSDLGSAWDAPKGKVVQPGHYINCAEKTSEIVNWCVAPGVRKRVCINAPTPTSPAVAALDPSCPVHEPTIHSTGGSSNNTQTTAVPATRQEPSVFVEALDRDAYPHDNLQEIIQYTDIAPREPNHPPWAKELQASNTDHSLACPSIGSSQTGQTPTTPPPGLRIIIPCADSALHHPARDVRNCAT